MNSPSPTIDLRSWGLLVFLSILWGGSYMFVGFAVKELTPLVIVFARVAIAASALLTLHLAMNGPLPNSGHLWASFIGMSLLNNVIPFTLIVTGQTMIASGLAAVITALTPLFAALALAAPGDEPLIPRKVAGLLCGLAGVAILKGVNFTDLGQQAVGIWLCMGAALSYGISALWMKRRLKGVPPITLATGQLIVSTGIMAVLAFAFDAPSQLLAASSTALLAVLGLALISTSLAYVLFFRIVALSGPANVQLVAMLIPVSAILFGTLFLNETLQLREIIGAAVIIAALAVFDGRVLGLLRKRQNPA